MSAYTGHTRQDYFLPRPNNASPTAHGFRLKPLYVAVMMALHEQQREAAAARAQQEKR
jgi:hypothetical protein